MSRAHRSKHPALQHVPLQVDAEIVFVRESKLRLMIMKAHREIEGKVRAGKTRLIKA